MDTRRAQVLAGVLLVGAVVVVLATRAADGPQPQRPESHGPGESASRTPTLVGPEPTPEAPGHPAPRTADDGRPPKGPSPMVGVVLTHSGEPVAGASVWLARLDTPVAPRDGVPHTRTDAAGRFELPEAPPPPGGEHPGAADRYAVAWAAGFVPGWQQLSEGAPSEPVVIRLERGLSITGCVLDLQGEPIVGARVVAAGRLAEELHGLDGTRVSFGPGTTPHRSEATSDAAGEFRMDGLPPGSYRVGAEHPDYLMPVPAQVVPLTPRGPVWDLLLEMAPILGVHALAVDAATGEPIRAAGYAAAVGADRSELLVRTEDVLAREGRVAPHEAPETPPRGARYYVVPRTPVDATMRVDLRVAAAGYVSTTREFELRPLRELGEPVRIPLERDRGVELVPLHLRANWVGRGGFTGTLVLKLLPHRRAGRHKIHLPVAFVDGRAPHPIPVPVGTHRLSVIPPAHNASLAFLRLPAGKPVDLVVGPGPRAEFTLELGGFEVLVVPRDAVTGAELRHLTLATLAGTRASGSVNTWSTVDLDRPPGAPGVRFWFSESVIELEVGKPGYVPARRTFRLEPGVRETWSVDLQPEGP